MQCQYWHKRRSRQGDVEFCAGGLTSPDDAAFDASFVQPYNAKSLQVPW